MNTLISLVFKYGDIDISALHIQNVFNLKYNILKRAILNFKPKRRHQDTPALRAVVLESKVK